MANELVTVGQRALAMRAERAEQLKKVTDSAKEGLFAGAPPSIGCKGTRFVVKDGPNEKVLDAVRIKGVIIDAKGPFDKAYYMKAYVPGDDASPDCFSRDSVRPDPQATMKQNAACAGCPRNVFGTAKDAQGNPSGGKACADSKITAFTVAERNEDNTLKCYQFKIPPASLGAWNKYVNELEQHGAYLPEVITEIGFNLEKSFPQYTFKMSGTVPDELIGDVYAAMDSKAVKNIVAEKNVSPPPEPASAASAAVDKVIEADATVVHEEDNTFGNLTLAATKPSDVAKEPKKGRPAKQTPGTTEVLPKETPTEAAVVMEPVAETAFGGFSDEDLNAKLGL